MILTIFGKLLLVCVVFPVLVVFYIKKGEGKKPGASKFTKWTLKNLFFWFLLIAVAVGAFIGINTLNFSEQSTTTERPLVFLPLPIYEKELDNYNPQLSSSTWEWEKRELLRKFKHAQHAWNLKDYTEALNTLIELETGKDMVGNLRKVESYVVRSNLGCVYFKIQGNKEFKASFYLQAAKELVKPGNIHRKTIDENLKNLDSMVNTLD